MGAVYMPFGTIRHQPLTKNLLFTRIKRFWIFPLKSRPSHAKISVSTIDRGTYTTWIFDDLVTGL
jgi:hypothetical protein